MSKKLDDLRRKIDSLDDKIHDVLMERAALIVDIAEEKRKENMQFVQPAREAVMIRRLLKRHIGALPPRAVVRIWRELVGAVSLMQTGLKVSVSMEQGEVTLWEMAKDYFGSVVPMQKSSSPLSAIASVREGESSFAVLPWPHESEENPWWTYLFNQRDGEKMKIVCALPYGSREGEITCSSDKGLVVSKIDFIASGEDHSFIAIDVDRSVSRARIVDALKKLDFEPLSLHTMSRPDAGGRSMHMVEIDDYLPEGDKHLKLIADQFEGQNARCVAIGGYPVPPVYKNSGVQKPVLSRKSDKKKTGT